MLTAPLVLASLSAGLLGGVHCVGMCGGLADMLGSVGKRRRVIPIIAQRHESDQLEQQRKWRIPLFLHFGRLCTYALMGGLVGALGALGMLFKPLIPVHNIMFVLGNLALILLGLRLIGYQPDWGFFGRLGTRIATRLHISPRFGLRARTRRHPFLVGMAWGCLPCGLIYAVLPFALLSGAAASGALLMLLFGLGALPYLLLAQGAAAWLQRRTVPIMLRCLGALALIALGLFGLWHVNMADMSDLPAVFCVTLP